jgi:hypothetical protein
LRSVQTSLLFAGVHVRAENVLIESYFRNRNGFKVNGSWIYSVQNCLEEFIAEFPNVIVDGKLSKITVRETGGVYRRKTTGQPLKRTAAVSAVIETTREVMQNAPHTSVRQLSQRNGLNFM